MLAKEEEGRVAERRLRLGAPGLTKMGYELDEAIKTNSVLLAYFIVIIVNYSESVILQTPAPASVLEQVSVPCADSIHFHTITRYANPDWADQLKCNFYMDDIKSNFVYVSSFNTYLIICRVFIIIDVTFTGLGPYGHVLLVIRAT